MNAKQFAAALKQLDLSHRKAAVVLGIGRASVIRYAHDQAEVPPVVARLIEMYVRHGVPKVYA